VCNARRGCGAEKTKRRKRREAKRTQMPPDRQIEISLMPNIPIPIPSRTPSRGETEKEDKIDR
jgi:hypothetical protein